MTKSEESRLNAYNSGQVSCLSTIIRIWQPDKPKPQADFQVKLFNDRRN